MRRAILARPASPRRWPRWRTNMTWRRITARTVRRTAVMAVVKQLFDGLLKGDSAMVWGNTFDPQVLLSSLPCVLARPW